MDKLLFAEKIGKSIILKHHNYFISEESEQDDLQHITEIKRTITGIIDHLKSENMREKEILKISGTLIDFSRDLFVNRCIEVGMEYYDNEEDDNGDKQTREDHIEWFNRSYEDEEYPY